MATSIATYKITLLSNGSTLNSDVTVEVNDSSEGPFRSRECHVTLQWDGETITAESYTVYHAFQEIRIALEELHMQAICFGACEDVQVTGMLCDWGDGTQAYRMSKAVNGELPPVVNIFESEESLVTHSVSEQRDYFERHSNGHKS